MSTNQTPLVSVVVPTFGRAGLVSRAVKTVLEQTMSDLEVIVVIDGQDPATVAALGEIDDPRLRVVAHEKNRGAGAARDTGGAESKGRWVAYLDDDDEWLPEKLEKQLALAAGSEKVVLNTVARVVTPSGVFVRPIVAYDGKRPLDEWLFCRDDWVKGGQAFLQSSCLMVPRDVAQALSFARALQHEEWEFMLRAVKDMGYPMLTVTDPVVIHYLGEMRPSLSKTYTWRRSLDWIDGVGELVTKRAYAGFCLTVISRAASNAGERDGFMPLLSAAFKKGKPSIQELFAFLLLWALPERIRRRLRASMQAQRAPAA